MRGTDFGGVHSYQDLHLIQQEVQVDPAEPRLNLIEVPGADGAVDLSDLPSGRTTYNTRTINWTFALYPGEDWDTKHRQVNNALNGRRCHITLDSDPEYYYDGRLKVSKHKVDGVLKQIEVEAVCQPYKLRQTPTVISMALGSSYKTLLLPNERKPVIPTLTVDAPATIRWQGRTVSVAAGEHRILDIALQAGENQIEAFSSSGTGRLTVTYQEGAL